MKSLKIIADIIAEKTRDRMASIHIDAVGLIRLGQTNRERLANFDRMIISAVNEGANIMVPTFSYTYPKNEVFDILQTPSDVGLATEFLRKRHSCRRTIDPFFSYLLFGPKESPHFQVQDYECFGDKSLIADLFNRNGYVCCIGNVFHNTPTEVHYLEKLIGIDYRFDKRFQGIIRDRDGKDRPQTTTFYCRKYLDELEPDMTRLEMDLKSRRLFEYWRSDGLDFEIQAVSIHRLYDLVKERISQNPMYLCSTPAEYETNLKRRLQGWRW